MKESPRRLDSLTWLRYVAALWIVCMHIGSRCPPQAPGWVNGVIGSGYLAMSFFFVLSGTVLVYGCWPRLSGAEAVKAFYVARFARIYPAYLVTYLLGLPALGTLFSEHPLNWAFVNVSSLFLVQNWFVHALVGINWGLWSLSCEAIFYALFPALLPFVHWCSEDRSRLLRALAVFAIFIGFAGLAPIAFQGRYSLLPYYYYMLPLPRVLEFILGMLVGAALRQAGHARPVRWWAPLGVAAVIFTVVSHYHLPLPHWTGGNLFFVPSIATLIYLAGRWELSAPPGRNGIGRRLLRYLGESSYCLFLAQMPIFVWLHLDPGRLARLTVHRLEFWIVVIIATHIGAILLHEGVEKPARRLILAWAMKKGAMKGHE